MHEQLFQQMHEAVIVTDTQGTIREWNPAAGKLFGHSRESAIGQPLSLIIPERFRPAHDAGFAKAVASGTLRVGGRVLTTRAQPADGRKLYVDFSFGLLKDDAGIVTGVFAVGREMVKPG